MTPRFGHSRLRWLHGSVAVLTSVTIVGLAVDANAATGYVPVSGAGSTWSANAIAQWAKNVNQYGLRINYAQTGSSDGRNQYRNGTVDFAVSEIPYGLRDNGVVDLPPTRKFAYLPIVAGGTSFMYNLRIGNKRVTELRLSGETIAKIFTGVVKNWADPEIKRQNPGLALPARKIVPVVRGDGSGTTAQFATYMSTMYPNIWNDYCRRAGRALPCGVTSLFPVINGSGFTAQSGSLGVAGYVSQEQNQGTITYVEYSYAINAGYPVVKLLNQAGYYAGPTAPNVAVGLLNARIKADLTQDLTGVYRNPDPRTYPMSSYSYMIVPTAVEGTFSEDKGRSLGAFVYYFLCEGQRQATDLGFSPLPINLVKSGLAQVRRIPGVDLKNVDIKKCNNPTFSPDGTNTLAKTAPQPPKCDKAGPLQCNTSAQGGSITNASGTGGGGSTGGGSSGTGGTTGAGTAAGGGTTGSGTGAAAGPTGGATAVDPDTGQAVGTGGQQVDGSLAAAVPVATDSNGGVGSPSSLLVIAALMLLAALVLPPVMAQRLSRDKS